MRILAVDDSPTMRQMIAATLRSARYEVVEAENGREALQLLESETVDLIISDLNMIVMDGFEFASKVRENPAYEFMPILFLTTEAAEDMKQIGREIGATGWLLKPFDPVELIKVVRRVCH
jgi:two-component system, chemotaxis family, chemotaxis protein CheY